MDSWNPPFRNFVFLSERYPWETKVMKISLILNGATAMALLGGFGLATPALAQGVNGPQYSTPAEKAQTQRLNEQAIDGTAESPAVLNGEATAQDYPEAPNNGAPMPGIYGGYDSASPSYQQQQYNEQMQDYQNQRDRYDAQRERYERAMDRYYRHRDEYEWGSWYPYYYPY